MGEKQNQNKPRERKWKKIIKTRAEINKNKDPYNKTKICLF